MPESTMTTIDRHRHRPPDPARGLPPPARGAARRASCSSRSSRDGSGATRSSAAARGSSRSRRRRRCGEPVVGLPRLRLRRRARADRAAARATGRGLPESRFVVADMLVRFDHVARRRGGAARRPRRGRRAARRPTCRAAARAGSRAADPRAFPSQAELRAGRRALQGAHPRAATPSRSCSRSGPSGRRRPRPLALYRALRRVNPSPVPLPARARRTRARRLLARDARQVRGLARRAQPDRRHDRGRATATPSALLASEKDRAEHVMLVDLGRNDLSRVCLPGHASRSSGSSSPSASRTSPTSSPRSPASCATASTPSSSCARRFPAGTVSGAPKVRAMQIISELEGYRRGSYAGAVALRAPRRRARHLHRDPDDRARTTASPTCRRAAGIVADCDPAAEHEECLRKLARARGARSTLAEAALDGAAPDRQLRLVHLQPGAPVRRARGGGGRAAKRRDRRSRRSSGSRPRTSSSRPGPAGPRTPGISEAAVARARGPRCRCSASASATRRSSRRSAARSGRRATLVHGKATAVDHDGRGLFAGLPEGFEAGRYHSLAATAVPRLPRGVGDGGRRRGDGGAPPRAAASTACSSIPSRCSPPTGRRSPATSWRAP